MEPGGIAMGSGWHLVDLRVFAKVSMAILESTSRSASRRLAPRTWVYSCSVTAPPPELLPRCPCTRSRVPEAAFDCF